MILRDITHVLYLLFCTVPQYELVQIQVNICPTDGTCYSEQLGVWKFEEVLDLVVGVLDRIKRSFFPKVQIPEKGNFSKLITVFLNPKVPEYDITHPYQSDEQGEFVSYSMHSQTRRKRDTRPQKSSFYKMNAFGTELHLKLKRNDHLMAPGMKVLRQHSDGTTTQHPAPENTYYLGHVASDPQSMVAVSNFGGLVRGFSYFHIFLKFHLERSSLVGIHN